MPPLAVEIPDEDDAVASAARSPLLAQARTLVEAVGDGLKLTQTGNLSLADARILVGVLATGDRVDETIGDQTFKTRSAADLPNLSFIVRVATNARFVRKFKGKLVTTKAGRNLGRDPFADLCAVVTAIDDTGMVTARTAGGRFIWTTLAPFFDDLFVPVAGLLLSAPRGVPFVGIVEAAFEDFEDEIDLNNDYWDETRRHDFVEAEMRTAMETLEAAGLVDWDSEFKTREYGLTSRTGGDVTLTPGGRLALYRYLSTAHEIALSVAPAAELTHHDFEGLIRACEDVGANDFQRLTREIEAWIDHRRDQAMPDLVATARSTDDPAVRNITLAVLGEHFGPAAAPDVRSMLDDPATRGAALIWLVDHGIEPPQVLHDPDPAVFVDVLALTLVGHGPDEMVELLDASGDHSTQVSLIQELRRQSSPAVGAVLLAVASHSQVPAIAKAARKAAMQHASFGSGFR